MSKLNLNNNEFYLGSLLEIQYTLRRLTILRVAARLLRS